MLCISTCIDFLDFEFLFSKAEELGLTGKKKKTAFKHYIQDSPVHTCEAELSLLLKKEQKVDLEFHGASMLGN